VEHAYLIDIGWVDLAYLVAAVLFILGIKGMTHPRTAVRGNLLSAWGMLLAVVTALLANGLSYHWILLGAVIGGGIGALAAVRVRMTQMPEMVALFNGFGGTASVLVAGAAFVAAENPGLQTTIAAGLSGLIGAVTFSGSLIAFLKLAEKMPSGSLGFPGIKVFNALLGAAALAGVVWLAVDPSSMLAYWLIVAVACVLGVTLTVPIGGADMPVVISASSTFMWPGMRPATGWMPYSTTAPRDSRRFARSRTTCCACATAMP
jgi:NAD(P) transhydrogenase subunit beta